MISARMNHCARFCPELSHTIPGEHGGRVACFCERRESSQHYQDWIINQSTARSSHFPDEDDICVLGSHQHIRPPDRKRRPHWSPSLHRGGGVGIPQSCVFLYLYIFVFVCICVFVHCVFLYLCIFVFVYLYLVAKRGMGKEPTDLHPLPWFV